MNDSRSLTRIGLIKLFSLLFVLAGGMTALEAQESANQGNISLSAGTNYTSAYYFRGFEQEDDGFITQPWAEIGADLYDGGNSSLSLTAGIWNSYHSENTGAGTGDDDLDALYETDYYAGLNYGYGDVSFGFSYVIFTSPNDAFGSIEELDYSVSYDDSDLLGDFALSPSFTIGQEIDAPGGDEGIYGELGFSPGTTFAEDSNYPVSVSLPTTFGLSLDDYYTDPADGDEEFLGYVSVGPHASVPLASGTKWGSWTLSGGVDWLLLTSDDAETSDTGNDSSEVIGTVSISMSY